jgi:hypothetical protein
MRLKALIWAMPLGSLLVAGCGSGSALLGGVATDNDAVALQAASAKPSIKITRPTLSTKKLPPEGGPLVVGATVTLKNLTPQQVTVTATALDAKRKAVAPPQAMALGEGNVWRTTGSGLTVPPNPTKKAVALTINVVVSTVAQPPMRKSLKAGSVSVAKSTTDPNQPPLPPSF